MGELIQDELKFYSKLTKPFILNLPDWKDRALAASWVKKIRQESVGTESLRVVYLKLLLFALQRNRLVGIFADDPGKYEELEAIPEGFDLNDIARNLLEVEFAERQDRIKQQLRGQAGTFPPYLTDCSSDFREYVAVQNVPGFGIHGYYAISKEPVNKWSRCERGIFPKLARSAVDTSSPLPEGTAPPTADELECICVEDKSKIDPECLCKKNEQPAPKPKKKQKRFGKTPPITPMGIRPPDDDRATPTWGSSLSQVKDAPKYVESDDDLKQVGAQGFALTDALGGFEQFVDEFNKGAMDKVSKIKATRVVVPGDGKVKQGSQATEGAEDEVEDGDEDEGEPEAVNLNSTKRDEDIIADTHLIHYYRDLLNQTAVKKAIALASENIITSSPARIGLPLSTPMSSPSPKRLTSSERLYQDQLVASTKGAPGIPMITIAAPGADGAGNAEEPEEEAEPVYPTDDEFTKWSKRLKVVENTCEVNLTQLDASQQVDKSVVMGKKRVPKQDQACGPGLCGYPCVSDARQQVIKTVAIGKKGVPRNDQPCPPGSCGIPCESDERQQVNKTVVMDIKEVSRNDQPCPPEICGSPCESDAREVDKSVVMVDKKEVPRNSQPCPPEICGSPCESDAKQQVDKSVVMGKKDVSKNRQCAAGPSGKPS